jgi:hypothetical protein
MKKMNEILSSTKFPMIVAKTDSIDKICVRRYKDKENNCEVLCNYMSAPLSPVSGKDLIPSGNKTTTLSSAELKSLTSLGTCPSCEAELMAQAGLADEIVASGKIHCIVCGEELEISQEEIEDAPAAEAPAEAEVCPECGEDSCECPEAPAEEAAVQTEAVSPEEMDEKKSAYLDKMDQNYNEVIDDSEKTLVEEADAETPSEEEISEDIKEDIENEAPESTEEVRVDMLSKCESNLKGKEMEIISSMKDTYHYLMVAHKPVATIHKARAVVAVQNMFNNRDALLKALAAATEKAGFTKEVVSNFGIVPVILKVTANDCIHKAIAEEKAAMEEKFEDEKAQAEEDMEQSLGMAAVALNRNLTEESNILAENLIAKFEGYGIEDAREMVESSFAEVGEDYLRTIIAKAKEYAKETPEARNVLAKAMTTAGFQKKGLASKANKVEASVIEATDFNVDDFRSKLSKLI